MRFAARRGWNFCGGARPPSDAARSARELFADLQMPRLNGNRLLDLAARILNRHAPTGC
jgi:hypothetical protein